MSEQAFHNLSIFFFGWMAGFWLRHLIAKFSSR